MPIGVGGFFTELGWKEILTMFGGMAGFSMLDGYVQGKYASYGTKKGWKEPDLYGQLASSATIGGLILIPGALRATKYSEAKGYISDVTDFFMNILGGGLLYEGAGMIEAITELWAPWAK